MSRVRSFNGWRNNDAKTGRAGFTLGSTGMATWPTPLPISMHFDRAPSGFTSAGGLISAWADQGNLMALAAAGGARPTLGALNSIASADFAPHNYFTQGSSPFNAQADGEVWMVVQGDNWEDTSLGVVLLNVYNESAAPLKELLFRVYGSKPPYTEARRVAIGSYNDTGPVSNYVFGDTPLQDGSVYVIRWLSTGSAWEIWINGRKETLTVDIGSNTGQWLNFTGTADRIYLGTYQGASFSLNGRVGFFDVLDGTLGTDEAKQWFRFLCRAFGATYLG